MRYPSVQPNTRPCEIFQFESWIAAVLKIGGCAVRFAEPPDLIIDLSAADTMFSLGCAAKRPRSVNKVQANCRDAVRQIRRSGLPCVVALDLSFALGVDSCVMTTNRESGWISAKLRSDEFLSESLTMLSKACDDVNTIAILMYLQLPVVVTTTFEITSAYRWTILRLLRPDDDRMPLVQELELRLNEGMFGDIGH